jgi:hypothetical protein
LFKRHLTFRITPMRDHQALSNFITIYNEQIRVL